MISNFGRSFSWLLFGGSALLVGSAANAQPDAEARDRNLVSLVAPQAARVKADDRAIVESQGLVGREGFAPTSPVFQLSTERGETEVSLGIAAEIGRTTSNFDPVSGDDRRTSRTSRFYLQGFAPIDDDDEVRFVNLAEPLDGARITLGFVHYTSNYTLRANEISDLLASRGTAHANCLAQVVAEWQRDVSPEEGVLGAQYLQAFGERMTVPGTRPESALHAINDDPRFEALPDTVTNRCIPGMAGSLARNTGQLLSRFAGAELADADVRALTGEAPTYFLGAEGTVSQSDFSFLDRTAFEIDSESHRGFEVTAFAGVISGRANWSLRGGISYSRAYEAQDSVELCRPVAGTSDIRCLESADGPPLRGSRTVFSLEGRVLIPLGLLNSNIGIAPELAIDADDGEYSLDVPVYFARNADDQLTGGIRLGYSSTQDDISFGFFVGVPFNIRR